MAGQSQLDQVVRECQTILAQCIVAANDAIEAVAQISAAGLAPLNSPFFTGNPQGPTPVASDASNSLATTAWIAGKFGQQNGLATLDNTGKVPIGQLPFTTLTFDGTWNAQTNSPPLVSSTGTAGHYRIVSVSGSTTLNGISTWNVGDQALFNGSVWQQVPFVAPPISNLPLSSLAGQANNTYVGNVSGTNAAPTAIAISTIINQLAPFTGDAGSGGSKGLVPAPSAGQGSGAFVLYANGAWGSLGAPNLSAYATLASPAFTGTATVSTQARNNQGSAIASTQFVVNQQAQATEVALFQVNGTASAGTSTYAAKADHIHGTDLSRAAAANGSVFSMTMTGTTAVSGVITLSGTTTASGVLNGTMSGGSWTLNGTVTLGGLATGITRSANDNSTKLATTAYVDSLVVTEAKLSFVNTTTANVTTAAHGLCPILPNNAGLFLNGVGTYTAPSAGLTGATLGLTTSGANAIMDTNNAGGIGAYSILQNVSSVISSGATQTNTNLLTGKQDASGTWVAGSAPGGTSWRNMSGTGVGSNEIGIWMRVS